MKNPLVTVIVAAYNAADYIEETLNTIIGQDYFPVEIIVVDDGSTDKTPEVIKSYGHRIFYHHQKNSGSCASPRNLGLLQATGKYVTFFDSDDLMYPNKISRQVVELEKNKKAVLCVGNYRNFTYDTKSKDHFSSCPKLTHFLDKSHEEKSITLSSYECRSILIDENFSIASSPLFRTKSFTDEPSFNTDLTACEDFDLIYRISSHGKVVIVPEVLFERRIHEFNMSSDSERMLNNLIASRRLLALYEVDPRLARRLNQRSRMYKRYLQAFLINKRRLGAGFALYKETLPPRSLSDLNHDLRQGVKLALSCLG